MNPRGVVLTSDEISQVLSGRKTLLATPVLLKSFHRTITPGYDYAFRDKQGRWNEYVNEDLFRKKCPYGPSKSSLFVRERWSVVTGKPGVLGAYVRYADGTGRACDMDAERPLAPGLTADRWRPALQMPEWASRIRLHNTEALRVVRLQDLCEYDHHAWGVRIPACGCVTCAAGSRVCPSQRVSYASTFRDAWNTSDRKQEHTYAANPWVWVVEFRLSEVKT